MTSYPQKIAKNTVPMDLKWENAQPWCNFIVFQPTQSLPGVTVQITSLRPESSESRASYRVVLKGPQGTLSVKQFLYDWAPPAYDHPCLWRNPEVATEAETPLPEPHWIREHVLWIGQDHRKKPAATILILRTTIEITVLEGEFSPAELIAWVRGFAPVDPEAEKVILATPLAMLAWDARHSGSVISVPVGYLKYLRPEAWRCFPYPANTEEISVATLPGVAMGYAPIMEYHLDSLFVFRDARDTVCEVEYYFESVEVPGVSMRLLVTPVNHGQGIPYPPVRSAQACAVEILHIEGFVVTHAQSLRHPYGSHMLIWRIDGVVACLILQSAPWTTATFAYAIVARLLKYKKIGDASCHRHS